MCAGQRGFRNIYPAKASLTTGDRMAKRTWALIGLLSAKAAKQQTNVGRTALPSLRGIKWRVQSGRGVTRFEPGELLSGSKAGVLGDQAESTTEQGSLRERRKGYKA